MNCGVPAQNHLDIIIICISYTRKLKFRGLTFCPGSLNLSATEPGMNERRRSLLSLYLVAKPVVCISDSGCGFLRYCHIPFTQMSYFLRNHSLCLMESQRHHILCRMERMLRPSLYPAIRKHPFGDSHHLTKSTVFISIWAKSNIYYLVKNKSSGGSNLWWHIYQGLTSL